MPSDLLASRLQSDPLSALIGCAALVPVVIWVIGCTSWMVMGDLEPMVGVLSVLVALFIGYVAMDPPSREVGLLALGSATGILIVFPFVRRQLDKQEKSKIEVEQVERAYSALSQKPTSPFLMFKLAESLYLRGMASHAKAIATAALAGMPKNLFPDEHRAVLRWRSSETQAEELSCLKCGKPNRATDVFCAGCGEAYLADYAKGRWIGKRLGKALLAAWIAASVALVGVPYVLSARMNPALSGTLVVVQLLVCAWSLWEAFFRVSEAAA